MTDDPIKVASERVAALELESTIKWYDRQGRAISMEEYSRLGGGSFEYRRVAQTTVGKVWISTVWLGLDHGFRSARPIIFETMIFGSRRYLSEEYMERYSTEEEALAGHQRAVEWAGQPGRAHRMVKHDRDERRARMKEFVRMLANPPEDEMSQMSLRLNRMVFK